MIRKHNSLIKQNKIISALTSMALLSFVNTSFATENQGVVHLSGPLLSTFGLVTAEYVTCQGGPPCQNPTKYTMIITSQHNDQKFQLMGVDTFFVSLKTGDGNYIWGPQAAEYGKNACTTKDGSNSFTFTLNNNHTITCTSGMD